MENQFFKFDSFENLSVGDVFKFCPTIQNNKPSRLFTVYKKDGGFVKFNSTYGKILCAFILPENENKEVMIFLYGAKKIDTTKVCNCKTLVKFKSCGKCITCGGVIS